MKVYLTRDVVRSCKIEVAEGNTQTGHPERLQVNGIGVSRYSSYSRICYKPEWHETFDEARDHALSSLRRCIKITEEQVKREIARLEKMKGFLATLETKTEE